MNRTQHGSVLEKHTLKACGPLFRDSFVPPAAWRIFLVEQTSERARYSTLWEAALRDAAGVVSSYLTPQQFGVATYSLLGIGGSSDFSREIQARVDLGRAAVLAELLPQVDRAMTTSYRHKISRSEGVVRGKLHIPRLVALRSKGDRTGIPVIRAETQMETPENLLVSEALRRAQEVCRGWRSTSGRESHIANNLLRAFQAVEARPPWADLRYRSRPPLRELGEIVLGRIVTGVSPHGGIMNKIANLFLTDAGSLAAFSQAASMISFLAVDDVRFEDRLFELLSLNWLLDALSSVLTETVIVPSRIRSGVAGPVMSGRLGAWTIDLSFQSGAGILPTGRWATRRTGTPLGAIPDLILRSSSGATERIALVDAKNRSTASESEVIYKLLGYKENLGISPFFAVGLYPSFKGRRIRRLQSGQNQVIIVHAPLDTGRELIRKLLSALVTPA